MPEGLDVSLIVGLFSLGVSIVALIFTILTFSKTKQIGKGQQRREEYSYLLFSIVVPFNSIETDIMLLAEGTFDSKFNKDEFDKEVLLAISTAKSFSRMIKNDDLFDYLDGLLTGEAKEQMGPLIEEYFKERNSIEKKMKSKNPPSKPKIKEEGERLLKLFFEKTRDMRDDTIDAIDAYLK